jgi:hypothetical protein
MIPLHPEVVDLFAEWTATNAEHIRRSRRLLADHHDPIDRAGSGGGRNDLCVGL